MYLEGVPPPWIAENLGFLLAKAGSVSAALFRQELAPLGIRPRHYSVLSVLVHTSQPCTQQMMAGCLELEPSSLVSVIDELEQRDLIRRQRDTADRRRNILVVTARGHEVVDTAREVARRLDDELFGELTQRRRAELEAALSAVAQARRGLHAGAVDDTPVTVDPLPGG